MAYEIKMLDLIDIELESSFLVLARSSPACIPKHPRAPAGSDPQTDFTVQSK